MQTFSALWTFVNGIHWSSVDSPHKGQCRGALVFSLLCAWTNGWANNSDAGDLRRHRAHYNPCGMEVWELIGAICAMRFRGLETSRDGVWRRFDCCVWNPWNSPYPETLLSFWIWTLHSLYGRHFTCRLLLCKCLPMGFKNDGNSCITSYT